MPTLPREAFERVHQIEEGASVREGQMVASIVDVDSPMRIHLRVPEAWVTQLSPKMKARVKVDAFADLTLDGEIIDVARRPDPPSTSSPNIKVYRTLVQIDRKSAGLRPGMTAEAEIVLGEREDAIAVPVGAVVLYDGKPHVALNRPDGRVEWRDVVLGATDDRSVRSRKDSARAIRSSSTRPLPERRAASPDEYPDQAPGRRPRRPGRTVHSLRHPADPPSAEPAAISPPIPETIARRRYITHVGSACGTVGRRVPAMSDRQGWGGPAGSSGRSSTSARSAS